MAYDRITQGTVRGGYTLINDGHLPKIKEDDEHPREPGLHLSGILSFKHGYSDRILIEPNDDYDPDDLMELGIMFETEMKRRMQILHPSRFNMKPKPLKLEGVNLTPDVEDYKLDAYWDFKFTTKSANAVPGDERYESWEEQLKSYCYAGGKSNGVLAVCHVMGEYRFLKRSANQSWIDEDGTTYREWFRKYTELELMANWEELMMVRSQGGA